MCLSLILDSIRIFYVGMEMEIKWIRIIRIFKFQMTTYN